MHSPVIEMESESISEDDQTIGNIPMKMAIKDQVTDQNQTNKVRKGILKLLVKMTTSFYKL